MPFRCNIRPIKSRHFLICRFKPPDFAPSQDLADWRDCLDPFCWAARLEEYKDGKAREAIGPHGHWSRKPARENDVAEVGGSTTVNSKDIFQT